LLGISLFIIIPYFYKGKNPLITSIDHRQWKFRWEYPDIHNTITSICKKCDIDLKEKKISIYYGSIEHFLYCPSCGDKYSLLGSDTLDDVEKVIMSKIRMEE
jgi:hypothetical protein